MHWEGTRATQQWEAALGWISVYRDLLPVILMSTVYFKASDLKAGIWNRVINGGSVLFCFGLYIIITIHEAI